MFGKNKKEEIKHEVTEEEVIENNLEGEVEVGEEVIIPTEEEALEEVLDGEKSEFTEPTSEEVVEEIVAPDEAGVRTTGYRECTCGALVPLPMEGEAPTKCDCGVEHIW